MEEKRNNSIAYDMISVKAVFRNRDGVSDLIFDESQNLGGR